MLSQRRLCCQLAGEPPGATSARRYFPTLLVVLLAVFNDGAMIALAKDRVQPSRAPNRWNLTTIFLEGPHRSLLPTQCVLLERLATCNQAEL